MGKYRLRRVPSGFKFDLLAENGQAVLTSEVYLSEAACRKGMESVRKNAPLAAVENQTEAGFQTLPHPKFQVYQDKQGFFRFRLKARNGEIIAVSDRYTAKAGCLGGIESAKRNAQTSPVVEE